MSHVYRWSAQLSAEAVGPVANAAPLHLRQSDLDGACGLHCALMALMLFGVVERQELEQLATSRKQPLAGFWKTSTAYYFRGLKARQLKALLKPYRDWLTCTLATDTPAREAGAIIDNHGIAILGIVNAAFSHWILAIGKGTREGEPAHDKLLVLDPGEPPIPMLAWNATLTLKPNRRGHHQYETAHGCFKVAVKDALLLQSKLVELDLAFAELLNED